MEGQWALSLKRRGPKIHSRKALEDSNQPLLEEEEEAGCQKVLFCRVRLLF
jgi:hypothetical protein